VQVGVTCRGKYNRHFCHQHEFDDLIIKVGFVREDHINILQKNKFVYGLLRRLCCHEWVRQCCIALGAIKDVLIESASISFYYCVYHLHL